MSPSDYLPLAFAGFMTGFAFIACAVDKRRAGSGRRRVPERTLLVLALLGGSLGLLTGMVSLRHKVRKPSFLARLLLVVAFQLGAAWLWFSARA